VGAGVSFRKILVANRANSGRLAAAAKPKRLVRAAHAGDFDPIETGHV
jgi:hypothetical protein